MWTSLHIQSRCWILWTSASLSGGAGGLPIAAVGWNRARANLLFWWEDPAKECLNTSYLNRELDISLCPELHSRWYATNCLYEDLLIFKPLGAWEHRNKEITRKLQVQCAQRHLANTGPQCPIFSARCSHPVVNSWPLSTNLFSAIPSESFFVHFFKKEHFLYHHCHSFFSSYFLVIFIVAIKPAERRFALD